MESFLQPKPTGKKHDYFLDKEILKWEIIKINGNSMNHNIAYSIRLAKIGRDTIFMFEQPLNFQLFKLVRAICMSMQKLKDLLQLKITQTISPYSCSFEYLDT